MAPWSAIGSAETPVGSAMKTSCCGCAAAASDGVAARVTWSAFGSGPELRTPLARSTAAASSEARE
jgi:hypothetical protein